MLTPLRRPSRVAPLAAALLLLVGCHATPPGSSTPPGPQAPRRARAMHHEADRPKTNPNDKVREQLQQRISVAFDKTPLAEALSTIADRASVKLVVNWPAFEAMKIPRDAPVALVLHQVPASTVLELVAQQVGAGGEDMLGPAYTVQNQTVVVSTLPDLEKYPYTRFYGINAIIGIDLIVPPSLRRGLHSDLARSATPPNKAAPSAPAVTLADVPATQTMRAARSEQIVSLIRENVGTPQQWAGPSSSIRVADRKLIIKTTRSNHLAIRALLDKLRNTPMVVGELVWRAEQHRRKQEYDAAMKLARQARAIAPDDQGVQAELRLLRQAAQPGAED